MKKGIASQVFVYIFAVIVIAFILYFGFTQIVNLKDLSDKSTYITFREDFKDAVNNVYYKSSDSSLVFSIDSRNKPLVLPKGVEEVYFSFVGDIGKISFDNVEYAPFEVEHLRKGDDLGEYIKVVKGRLSFKLTNEADEEETFVRVENA